MSKAVIARMLGDDYQALYFWNKACGLFQSHSKMKTISYEYDLSKSFDDVVIEYEQPIPDERGRLVHADYYQIKFHVTLVGEILCSSLIEPSFINAQTISFLQRLKDAVQLAKSQGKECRFYLVTPWSVSINDPLSKLISNVGGELRLDKLMDGTTDNSSMGKIRKMWREHLDLKDDRELYDILDSLRIYPNSGNMKILVEQLNIQLIAVGLLPIEEGTNTHKYVDLIQGLLKKNKFTFTREELLVWCRAEGLYDESILDTSDTFINIGIRSFHRWAENMEHETEQMICYTKYFDGRYLRDTYNWISDIANGMVEFIKTNVKPGLAYNLHLDTHTSIAFAAGHEFHVKSGIDIAPIQKSFKGGKQVWRPTDVSLSEEYSDWNYIEHLFDKGSDVAIAISVTHDISDDVTYYIEQRNLPIKRTISCFINVRGPGATSVVDANHAAFLASRISTKIRSRSINERQAHLHIFYSGPNGLIFFIGQLSHSFGACTVYEYDFSRQIPGGYQPTITFPLVKENLIENTNIF